MFKAGLVEQWIVIVAQGSCSCCLGEDGLLVEKILPGGAIEAWNKQCPGEIREIRPGDSIPRMLGRKVRTKHWKPPNDLPSTDALISCFGQNLPGITMINGHEASKHHGMMAHHGTEKSCPCFTCKDPELMRHECLTKLLLKMTVPQSTSFSPLVSKKSSAFSFACGDQSNCLMSWSPVAFCFSLEGTQGGNVTKFLTFLSEASLFIPSQSS